MFLIHLVLIISSFVCEHTRERLCHFHWRHVACPVFSRSLLRTPGSFLLVPMYSAWHIVTAEPVNCQAWSETESTDPPAGHPCYGVACRHALNQRS
ncbi:hypothetical protein BJX68DRAFT_207443 [Aspergillus pseudodeflectus]|uniref:Secreted protein n=1 Tax=Aspergillus pseudodeflectus TaxID=176178 RepID=A0ABR4KVS3_9EURO